MGRWGGGWSFGDGKRAEGGGSTQVWKYPILERLVVGSTFGKSRFVFENERENFFF